MNDYYVTLITVVGINLILVQSFNFAFGLGAMFNLGHIAFYAVGAYTTAILSTELHYSLFTCMAASMAVGGALALMVGCISLRLSSDYFAIGTLAFHAVISALLVNWKDLTKGVLGITGIERPALCLFEAKICKLDFSPEYNYMRLVLAFAAISMLTFYLLRRSAFGRSLRAQAEYEPAAMALGKPTVRIRILTLVISAFGAAIAGGLFAYFIRYIDPSSFALNEMIFVFTVTVLGRPGSFWGVMLATAFLTLLPEPLRRVGVPADILGPMRQLLYALLLFAAVYWNRRVLFPVQRQV